MNHNITVVNQEQIEQGRIGKAALLAAPALVLGTGVMFTQQAQAAIVSQSEANVVKSEVSLSELRDSGAWPVNTASVSLDGVGETGKLLASLERNDALQLRQVIDTEAVLIAREQPTEPLHSAVSVVAVALLAVVALARRYS